MTSKTIRKRLYALKEVDHKSFAFRCIFEVSSMGVYRRNHELEHLTKDGLINPYEYIWHRRKKSVIDHTQEIQDLLYKITVMYAKIEAPNGLCYIKVLNLKNK